MSIGCCTYLHIVVTPIRVVDDVCSIQLRAERRLQEDKPDEVVQRSKATRILLARVRGGSKKAR